jgi:hypothetical protein
MAASSRRSRPRSRRRPGGEAARHAPTSTPGQRGQQLAHQRVLATRSASPTSGTIASISASPISCRRKPSPRSARRGPAPRHSRSRSPAPHRSPPARRGTRRRSRIGKGPSSRFLNSVEVRMRASTLPRAPRNCFKPEVATCCPRSRRARQARKGAGRSRDSSRRRIASTMLKPPPVVAQPAAAAARPRQQCTAKQRAAGWVSFRAVIVFLRPPALALALSPPIWRQDEPRPPAHLQRRARPARLPRSRGNGSAPAGSVVVAPLGPRRSSGSSGIRNACRREIGSGALRPLLECCRCRRCNRCGG